MLTRLSVAVILLAACGHKSDESGGTASGSAPPAPAPGLHVFVDDKEVAVVQPAQAATWPRVDTIVPENARRLGKWQAITLKTAKPQPSTLETPFQTYHDFAPALFPGADGKISFGMFDPVELGKHGKPALEEDGVTELRIKLMGEESGRGGNDQGGNAAVNPQDLKLTITVKGADKSMTGDKLLAIPRDAMPGGGGDAKGWKLGAILEAVGAKDAKKVRLTDAGGPTLTLETAELSDAKTQPFIKLNRQGSLRFRVYKQQGDGWQPAGDLRSLSMIEVLE